MEEIVECTHFRAGVRPALEQALKTLGVMEELERMKNGEILLPDGRRVVCEMFFDEVNYDNLCVKCIISE